MTRREAGALAGLVDAVVAPRPPLPPVHETDAVAAFAEMLRRAPRLNSAGMRAALLALDAAPLALGRPRLRSMPREERLAFLARMHGVAALGPLLEGLRTAAAVSYYGDAGVLEVLAR